MTGPFDMAEMTREDIVPCAESMSRNKAMKYVIGPLVTELLQPLYEEPFSDEERNSGIKPTGTNWINGIAERSRLMLEERLYATTSKSTEGAPGALSQFARLVDGPKGGNLFFHLGAENVLREGIASGINIPLTVASHIGYLEGEESPDELEMGQVSLSIKTEAFDRILQHLTRGPNGFLGGKSLNLTVHNPYFFDFRNPHTKEPLNIEEAYVLDDGAVVGLSGLYHEAANVTRENIVRKGEKKGGAGHRVGDSSGCPVRHRFDRACVTQEPLIITAKNFLVRVIEEASERKEIPQLATS